MPNCNKNNLVDGNFADGSFICGIYAVVIISVSNKNIDRLFYYRIPEKYLGKVFVGTNVIVPFGQGNKPISAIVVEITDSVDIEVEKVKTIIECKNSEPIISKELIKLVIWMRDKYFSSYADCMKCVLPSGMHLKRIRAKHLPITSNINLVSLKPDLTAEQKIAFEFIKNNLHVGCPILLHGVTGSGKTEIYLRIIEIILAKNQQAIVLVPEIALTPQTVSVFTERFGEEVMVTHSRLSAGERFDRWQEAKSGSKSIIIGPRSAVFTPFSRLGAIIIDEEHEHTYKSETTPKYSAQEIANKRSELTGAVVVLGSATPSLNTFYKAQSNQIAITKLKERVNKNPPNISIVDMRLELARGNRSIFSAALADALMENIKCRKQSILFLNRRGHSTFVSCRSCGAVMKCDNCSVNYTYHIASKLMLCHYCGKTTKTPVLCPFCGSKYIKYFGVGTQKVEEEIRKFFPDENILRMDMDTTSKKNSHDKLLNTFKKGEASILIGTQMIAKGLDFPNVTLVGVIAADVSLNNGDFSAGETTFQLLTQVSGRAGRADYAGKVFIQTYMPQHYSIVYAKEQNYEEFYRHEISLRRQMNYPPFRHIFSILFSGETESQIVNLLSKLLDIIKINDVSYTFETLGPAPAQISKIKNRYRWKLLVKGIEEESLKNFVLHCICILEKQNNCTDIRQQLTLDPVVME